MTGANMEKPNEEATGTKAKAESFMRRALKLLDEVKREKANDAELQRFCDAFGFCLERFYTKSETVSHMTIECSAVAESVRALYDGIMSRTGDISGAEAYTTYSQVAEEGRIHEARVRSGASASVSPYCEKQK